MGRVGREGRMKKIIGICVYVSVIISVLAPTGLMYSINSNSYRHQHLVNSEEKMSNWTGDCLLKRKEAPLCRPDPTQGSLLSPKGSDEGYYLKYQSQSSIPSLVRPSDY